MPRRIRLRLVAGLVLGGLVSASIVSAAGPAKGRSQSPKTVELCGITWHTSFQAACESGKGKGRDPGKPVLHLRVLGDLDGFM